MDRTEARKGPGRARKDWSPDDWKRAISRLCLDLGAAGDHFELWQRLGRARESKYARAFGQSQTFWWLTFRAHLEETMFRLCRAYDQHLDTLSLRTLVLRIRDTPSDLLPPPDPLHVLREEDVAGDLEFVSEKSNDLVRRLMVWRHKEYAHRDVTYTLNGGLTEKFPITWNEITLLLDKGLEIANRYNGIFFGSIFSRRIHAHDDFERLLKVVEDHLVERETALRREIERLRAAEAETESVQAPEGQGDGDR